MFKLTLHPLLLMLLNACGGSIPTIEPHDPESGITAPDPDAEPEASDFDTHLLEIEAAASPEGRAILAMGREMIEDEVVIKGGCWGYIHELYSRAGFPPKRRMVPFKGKKRGPYAPIREIQPGDWLYYINHSYGGSTHSGIFVEWLDFKAKEALILSYGGGGRDAPGRYRSYTLSGVYRITRPKP